MGKIGVLVVGCGSIGMRHIRCFQQSGKATVFATDTSSQRRNVAEATHGIPCSAEPLEAIRSGETEAVVIATPAPSHLLLACEAARAGKHVLIEKPLSLNLEGVEELMGLAREKALKVQVAYVYRFRKVFQGMKAFVDQSEMGKPLAANLKGGQPFDEKRPGYESTYFAKHESGGGVIQDGLCHYSDLLSWFVGRCDRIMVHGCHSFLKGITVEDTVTMMGEYGKMPGLIHMNLFQAPTDFTMELHYEKGSVKGELHNNRWGFYMKGDTDWTWYALDLESADDPFIAQAIAFLDHISGEQTHAATLQDGIHQTQIIQTALELARSGKDMHPIPLIQY